MAEKWRQENRAKHFFFNQNERLSEINQTCFARKQKFELTYSIQITLQNFFFESKMLKIFNYSCGHRKVFLRPGFRQVSELSNFTSLPFLIEIRYLSLG